MKDSPVPRRSLAVSAFVSTTVFAMVFASGAARADEGDSPPIGLYVAAGLSLTNQGDGTFGETTYPSAEIGISRGAGAVGLVVGRGDNDFSGDEELEDYWSEFKIAVSAPVGEFSIYGLLGLGLYVGTSQQFIEYGVGVSRGWDSWSIFAQASNWDGLWYVTPGAAYSF